MIVGSIYRPILKNPDGRLGIKRHASNSPLRNLDSQKLSNSFHKLTESHLSAPKHRSAAFNMYQAIHFLLLLVLLIAIIAQISASFCVLHDLPCPFGGECIPDYFLVGHCE